MKTKEIKEKYQRYKMIKTINDGHTATNTYFKMNKKMRRTKSKENE